MENERVEKKKKRPLKKILLWALALILLSASITGVYIYRNFNQLLSVALLKNFNSTVISDIYELKFERLRVNILAGNINVINVIIQPRSTPLRKYQYINSSFNLTTRSIRLENVEIMTLLKSGKLKLRRIEINNPEIEVNLNGEVFKFLPVKDTLAVKGENGGKEKKFITGFSLKEFELTDASFLINEADKERKISVQKLNISLNDLIIDQHTGIDLLSFEKVGLNIAQISGGLQTGGFRTLSLKNFSLNVSSLEIRKSIDTLIFSYAGFDTGLNDLNLNTADSTFNISVGSLDLNYDTKSVTLNKLSFKPNISRAELSKREKYRKSQFAVSLTALDLVNVNFDTLLYRHKLYVDEIKINNAEISLYKDKTKPLDKRKFPEYAGQQLSALPLPLRIKSIRATGVSLANVERKVDGKYAKVMIQRGLLLAKNITTLPSTDRLSVTISGYLENRAFLTLNADFSYQKPQFSFNGRFGKFNLEDLNNLLAAYSPAAIKKGTVDAITFSGRVNRTNATGTMKFLYHDLDIDLKLKERKSWQSSVVTFAANTYLNAGNPPSPEKPPRIVTYTVDRDMNKGGFNIVLKSLLSGMKETMIMSKENKRTYKEEKKRWKLRK